MSFKIELTERFKKEFKRLNKSYPSIKKELDDLVTSLEDNPIQSTSIGMDFIKFVWLLQVREKVNGAVQE